MVFKSACFIILVTVSLQLKGQDYFQQITFGALGGITRALSGASVHNNSNAFGVDIGYYQTPYFNILFEAQAGKLVGSPSSATLYKNKKTFLNNYQSFFVGANVGLGSFYDEPGDGIHKVISRFYFGGGMGLMNNRVNRLDEFTLQTIAEPKRINLVVPVEGGYEFTVVSKDEIPLIKADLSFSANFTGRAIDGYYDTPFLTIYFYTYASVGIKYAIRTGPPRHRSNLYN